MIVLQTVGGRGGSDTNTAEVNYYYEVISNTKTL